MKDDSVVVVVDVGRCCCFVVVVIFLRGGNRCLPRYKRNGFSLITITPVGMGKP